MKIGELARLTGTAVETIRFYEREGLLPEAARTSGNYRVYGDEQAERLAFIRRCRSLDMTLGEIRALLAFKSAPQENCQGVNELIDEHIGHVARRIGELKSLEAQLRQLRHQCSAHDAAAGCGILKELSEGLGGPGDTPAVSRHVHGAH